MKTKKIERDRITVSLVGLAKGSRSIQGTYPAESVPNLPSEFQSEITIDGSIQRLGQRVLVDATLTTNATLICDRSLEEYNETITAELALECKFDNDLALSQRDDETLPEGPLGLFEDAREIDLSEPIRQELFLSLPMKRVAPHLRGVSIEEIHPSINNDDGKDTSGTWDALKKLK